MLVNIDDKLYNDILNYLHYNNINDIEKEINKYILKSFNIEKYGLTPFSKFKEVVKDTEQKSEQKHIVEKEVKTERKKRTKKEDKIEMQEQTVEETTEPIIEVEKPKRKVRIIKK